MSQTWEDLPFECWETIFSQIQNPNHLQPLSLVSKCHLSATNAVRSSLTIDDPTANILPRLLLRFPNLRHIAVKTTKSLPLDALIRSLAASHLRLRSLDLSGQEQIPISAIHALGRRMDPTLRILSCRNLEFLRDRDLTAIADSFPSLEVLDIAYPRHDVAPGRDLSPTAVTDAGIAELSSKLRNLRSIDVSGNSFLSDYTLIVISRNCRQIAELRACDCIFMTSDGVHAVIRLCSNLISLSVDKCSIPPPFNECVSRVLSSLELSHTSISDEWLFSLLAPALPLRKLALPCCQGFTFAGISALLSRHQSLQHLDLENAAFLTDSSMLDLLGFLRCLISINLNSCPYLKNPTLFSLVRSCPSLEEISMESSGLGEDDSAVDLVENHRIRTLKLARNRSLSDETVETLGSVCSGLLSLDVSGCWSITEMGISEIGNRCIGITELKVIGCRRLKNLGMGGASFPKLEVLKAAGTGMEDEGLAMVGKQGCGALRVLDLEGCWSVTERGIKELLRSNGGKGLKEVNLRRCCNVNGNVLAWMVFSGPSLKKIVPPPDYTPSERQQELFLRHGCMVG
ncbi:hypothetical protein ACLOJK_027471 [Asimina triloba]